MTYDIVKERQRLSQQNMLRWINSQIQPNEMLTVYFNDVISNHSISIYCALLPNDQLNDRLNETSWDLCFGDGLPGAVRYHREDGEQVIYLRFGEDNGVEPLVICREFHGMREDYPEISEEFRLFHRLYYDRKQEQYIKIDNAGNEQVVAIVEPNCVKIRLLEIKQFLAIKEMHIAVMFDFKEYSELTLKDLGLVEKATDHRDELLTYSFVFGALDIFTDNHSFSRVHGKRLFPPFPKEKSGFWGFAPEEPKKHVDFIIGVDENGNEVANTSDEYCLANNFGANSGQPHYLTPVHFRKEVLDKYYQQPRKYSVEDGYLRCGGLWGIQIDNFHDDRVIAWLGDLGRDLPYEEQLYWRSFNIAPSGNLSKTFFRRQILAQFTDSDRPEHLFQHHYKELTKSCKECLGWDILLPLAPEDEHHFQCLRVPSAEEQKDFDELVLALTKIIVDSLNEKELNKLIPEKDRDGLKGSILRLEKVLVNKGVKGYEEFTNLLRSLQSLRSSGAAHRKGSNYRKIAEEFCVDSKTLRAVFQGILMRGLAFLQYLNDVVRSGALRSETEASKKKT